MAASERDLIEAVTRNREVRFAAPSTRYRPALTLPSPLLDRCSSPAPSSVQLPPLIQPYAPPTHGRLSPEAGPVVGYAEAKIPEQPSALETLSREVTSIVEVDEGWADVSCHWCGANANRQAGTCFRGVAGLEKHGTKDH